MQPGCSVWLVRLLFSRVITDPVCRVRACRRQVLQEIIAHNVQQHFSPLLAAERGFQIAEVVVRPSEPPPGGTPPIRPGSAAPVALWGSEVHSQAVRFFGTIGPSVLLIGLVLTGYLRGGCLFFRMPLADRPALILGVLLIVLGIQVIELGLIGEIIIFAAGKRIKDDTIDRIL
jgi:hypothetical protein